MRFRRLLLAFFLACAPVSAAADELSWISQSTPEGVSLLYGAEASDWIVISFRCHRASKELTVEFDFEPVGAQDGMMIDLELSSEAGRVVLPAIGQRMLLDDIFLLEARTQLDAELHRLLSDGTNLIVTVQDGAEEIPLAGAEQGIKLLTEACAP